MTSTPMITPTLTAGDVGQVGSNITNMLGGFQPFIVFIIGMIVAFYIARFVIELLLRMKEERIAEENMIREGEDDMLAYMVANAGTLDSDFIDNITTKVANRKVLLGVSKGEALREEVSLLKKEKKLNDDLSNDPYFLAKRLRERMDGV